MKVLFFTMMTSLIIGFTSIAQSSLDALLARKRVVLLMGTRFELTAVAPTSEQADAAIDAGIEEVKRIERLISSWDDASQTSEINRYAGIQAVKVDKELYDLIDRSIQISKLTNGSFDISFASISKLWKFDGTMTKPPSKELIDSSVININYNNIILDHDNSTVFLKNKGMMIGFGGIGKGYAAERAKKIMIALGIKNGVVSAAGDLTTWGKREDGKIWDVAIAKPDKSGQILAWLQANETSVVTSGNYEKFFKYKGVRYAHIIDPRTGYPTTGIKSATIVCTNAEFGDALATSMFVMGKEKGISLINQLKGIECLLITDDDKLVTSNHLFINYQTADTSEGSELDK